MSLDAFEFLFFDSAREASNDVYTFSNLKFIKLKVKVSLNVPDHL